MASLYSVYLHIVFSTKNREEILTNEIKDDVFYIFQSVAGKHHSYILACNGMEDHIHLLMKFQLNINVSDVIKEMKRVSSFTINNKSKFRYFYWQHHYAAFSVSESICPRVINYIKNQQMHHKRQSFLEELESFAYKCKEKIDDDFYE